MISVSLINLFTGNLFNSNCGCVWLCLFMQEFGLQQLQEGSAESTFRSFLCNMLLLCYHTFMSFILGEEWDTQTCVCTCSCDQLQTQTRILQLGLFCLCLAGTGEGDVEDAEKLLQPYIKKYPKVCHDLMFIFFTFNVKHIILCLMLLNILQRVAVFFFL